MMGDQPSETISDTEKSLLGYVPINYSLEDNMMVEHLATEFVSAIKINSRPILAPVITKKVKEELMKWKEMAIIAENRLKMRRLAKEARINYSIPRYDYSRYTTKEKTAAAPGAVPTIFKFGVTVNAENTLEQNEMNLNEPNPAVFNKSSHESKDSEVQSFSDNNEMSPGEKDQRTIVDSQFLEENEYYSDSIQTISTQIQSPIAKQNKNIQINSPDAKQNINIQTPSPIAIQNVSTQLSSPNATQNVSIQIHSPDASLNVNTQISSPDTLQNISTQTHSPDLIQSISVQAYSPVAAQNASTQSPKTKFEGSYSPSLYFSEDNSTANKLKSIENTEDFLTILSEDSTLNNSQSLNYFNNKENCVDLDGDSPAIDNSDETDFDVASINTLSLSTFFEDKSINESCQPERSSVLDLVSQYSFEIKDKSFPLGTNKQQNNKETNKSPSVRRQNSYILDNPSIVLLRALKDGKISSEVPSLEHYPSSPILSEKLSAHTCLSNKLNTSPVPSKSKDLASVYQAPKWNKISSRDSLSSCKQASKKPKLSLGMKKNSNRKVGQTKTLSSKKINKPFVKKKLSKKSEQLIIPAFKSKSPKQEAVENSKDLSSSFKPLPFNFQPDEIANPYTIKPNFSKLSAFVKGHLTRRLFKTIRVCTIIAMIQRVLHNALKLQEEANNGIITLEIVEIHQNFINQINSSITELSDIFHLWPIKDQMQLIAHDRELKTKEKQRVPAQVKPKVSSATLKYRQRKSTQST